MLLMEAVQAMERARKALGALSGGQVRLDHVFQQACLDICETVGATRASIWFFNAAGNTLTCEQLYDSRGDAFRNGDMLEEALVPAYFAALRRDGTVRADDAMDHAATAEFRDGYFAAWDIRSLLDHVVFAGAAPVSVLCAENCGTIRNWSDADCTYLSQMAILLGIAIGNRRASYSD